jgi:hypothetical protein
MPRKISSRRSSTVAAPTPNANRATSARRRCVKAGIAWTKTVIVLPVINEDEVVLIILRRSPMRCATLLACHLLRRRLHEPLREPTSSLGPPNSKKIVQKRGRDNRQKVGNGRAADRMRLLSCWNCWRTAARYKNFNCGKWPKVWVKSNRLAYRICCTNALAD